jgi:hypothetical protein
MRRLRGRIEDLYSALDLDNLYVRGRRPSERLMSVSERLLINALGQGSRCDQDDRHKGQCGGKHSN